MEKDCTGLMEIMGKQLGIYRSLLSLALEKQPVLVKGNISELERITKEEELLILQVGRLEEQRRALHQALANHFVLSPEELTLTELIKRTDQEAGAKFQQLFAELGEILNELADINLNNTDLINSSLDYINISLNLLTDSEKSSVYAGNHDEKKTSSAAKIFDRTV